MYQPFETFLFRTPFFSFSALHDFEKKQNELVFKEMLQIATPDLTDGIDKGTDKAHLSAYRYYQRACTRPTPFGLFAGCSMGVIGRRTEIELSDPLKYKRVTRLDMNYICALTQMIERDKNIRKQLHYEPNNSIYPVGNHLRYVEYHYRKTRRIHQIKQTEQSDYLTKVLALAGKCVLFSDLVSILVDNEITEEEAAEFIHDLIDAQVLVSELEPAVTEVQPLSALIEKLNVLPNINRTLTDVLRDIEKQLNAIDRQPIGYTHDSYQAIIKNIEKTKIETEIKYLFQSDLFKPVQCATVSRNVIKEIQQVLTFLNKTNSVGNRTHLEQFNAHVICIRQ